MERETEERGKKLWKIEFHEVPHRGMPDVLARRWKIVNNALKGSNYLAGFKSGFFYRGSVLSDEVGVFTAIKMVKWMRGEKRLHVIGRRDYMFSGCKKNATWAENPCRLGTQSLKRLRVM